LLRCKEIFKGHIFKKRGFGQHKGGLVDNTNYTVVSASNELSGIKDSWF
jgi:hypothetical protein